MKFSDNFVAWIELKTSFLLGSILPHRFHHGAHLATWCVLGLKGDNRVRNETLTQLHLFHLLTERGGEPFDEILAILLAELGLLFRKIIERDLRAVRADELLALKFTESFKNVVIDRIGEERHLDPALLEGFEVGTIDHRVTIKSDEVVDLFLIFLGTREVVSKRGLLTLIQHAGFETKESRNRLVMLGSSGDAFF